MRSKTQSKPQEQAVCGFFRMVLVCQMGCGQSNTDPTLKDIRWLLLHHFIPGMAQDFSSHFPLTLELILVNPPPGPQ